MTQASPIRVLAYARAGSLDAAWSLFLSSGLGERADDPSALTLKGRLLKDLAGRAGEEERKHLLREAAATYRRAADLTSATYPRINAATLSLLGGDAEASRQSASRILSDVERFPDEPETPYWRAATRAEALLLLARHEDARTVLTEAIALAPRAWEDHAVTLRQFRLILEAQGLDASWLDPHRPPRSLHFCGHMSFDAGIVGRDELDAAVRAVLQEERIGFGYGALAAGADIIIAEALVELGAELHAMLPGGAEAFASISVDPLGENWRRRFDQLIGQAETVRTVRPEKVAPGPQAIGLSDEIAMGAAVMNARRLESEAIQLLITDADSGSTGQGTVRAQAIWAESRRRQKILQAPREAIEAAQLSRGSRHGKTRPLAVVAVLGDQGLNEEQLERELRGLRDTIAERPGPRVSPYWTGGCTLLAYDCLQVAADLALSLARSGYRVGADYLAVPIVADPFSGGDRLTRGDVGPAEAAASSTPQGSACVTEDFAAALAAKGDGRVRCEFVGELDPPASGQPIGLYALK